MDHNQLPDYIRNKQGQAPSLAHKAIGNVGAGAGPYLSIMGDRFTFVDLAGNERPVDTLYVDVVIVDVNDHMSKMFYSTKYDPQNPTPPTCFSDNGLAPSVAAGEPQSPTCQSCRHNVWGSKISEMGSRVKACRDEQKLAIIVPGMAQNMFRLTVPPNSLTNWRAYVAKFLNAGFDMSDVVTRLSFEGGGERGTLQFSPCPQPWLDAATLSVRDQAVKSRASDIIVGRLDKPRQAALAPPIGASEALDNAQFGRTLHERPAATPPFPASSAGFQPMSMASPPTQAAPPAAAASFPSESPPARRRRRTKEEMQQAQQPGATVPAMAPFRPEATNAGGNFGIQNAPPPNAEIQNAVRSIFGE